VSAIPYWWEYLNHGGLLIGPGQLEEHFLGGLPPLSDALAIADDRIRQFVEAKLLRENVFWPDALIQLNPSYRLVETVDDLGAARTLLPATASIFRTPSGDPIQLYQHQREAIQRAAQRQSYVVTCGTGSGKSLAYFVPIFDTVLRGNHQERKVSAIVIYPMNALVNSEWESLTALATAYRASTGQPMPVRFDKYNGQEDEAAKNRIQQERPHILLTNFMMLEMMLLRPQEAAFRRQNDLRAPVPGSRRVAHVPKPTGS
jgi:ATP-dependent helicase YprA (DUF1998 family)